MKRTLLTSTIGLLLVAGGCASQADGRATAQAAPTMEAPPSQAITLPTQAGAGKPKEVKILLDESGLRLATIALRKGTVLPEHATPAAVTIIALEGAGSVTANGRRLRIDRGHAIVLAANVAHVVEPDAGTDLLLLIHHLPEHKRRDAGGAAIP